MKRAAPPAPHEVSLLAAVLVGGAAVLAVSSWLVPDPRGLGTHEQLGLPPCGFELATGLPCPTCGLTTSFALMARLEVGRAARAQPFGVAAFLAVAAATLVSLFHLVAWRSPRGLLARLPRAWVVLGAGAALLLASWLWRIARARAGG